MEYLQKNIRQLNVEFLEKNVTDHMLNSKIRSATQNDLYYLKLFDNGSPSLFSGKKTDFQVAVYEYKQYNLFTTILTKENY